MRNLILRLIFEFILLFIIWMGVFSLHKTPSITGVFLITLCTSIFILPLIEFVIYMIKMNNRQDDFYDKWSAEERDQKQRNKELADWCMNKKSH